MDQLEGTEKDEYLDEVKRSATLQLEEEVYWEQLIIPKIAGDDYI